MTRPSTGVYCVTLAPGIDISAIAPIAALDKHYSATTIPPPSPVHQQGSLEWDSIPEDCPTGTLEFDSIAQDFNDSTGALIGNIRSNQSFTVLIP